MNKVALITGAAKGIGAAIALKLAKEMDVVLNYSSSATAVEEIATQARQYGHEVTTIKCDVSNYDEVLAMMNTIMEKHTRLDILVNNAGITADNLLLRMSEADYDRVMDINAKGCFNCMKHATKIMMKQRSGIIVNMASVIGVIGNVGQLNYAASKAAIIAMSKSAAKELASRNIRVNAVAPGYIETSMTESLNPQIKENILTIIPLQKLGQAEDVANLVEFLVSDKSQYITGQVIHVDGGMVI